jgi:hypothetical protein
VHDGNSFTAAARLPGPHQTPSFLEGRRLVLRLDLLGSFLVASLTLTGVYARKTVLQTWAQGIGPTLCNREEHKDCIQESGRDRFHDYSPTSLITKRDLFDN